MRANTDFEDIINIDGSARIMILTFSGQKVLPVKISDNLFIILLKISVTYKK